MRTLRCLSSGFWDSSQIPTIVGTNPKVPHDGKHVPSTLWSKGQSESDEMDFTDERKSQLREAFLKAAGEAGTLEWRAAYELTFTPEERSEYGFSNFEEDLKATQPDCPDQMNWAQLTKFLDDNL